MRLLLALLVILVAFPFESSLAFAQPALGKDAKPEAKEPEGVDPESVEKTLAFLHKLANEFTKTLPLDNEILAEQERKLRAEKVKALTGHKVRWTLKVERVVNNKGTPVVYPQTLVSQDPKKRKGLDRKMVVGIPSATPSNGAPWGLLRLGGFAVSRGEAAKLRRGDAMSIEGTIVDVKVPMSGALPWPAIVVTIRPTGKVSFPPK